MYKMSPSIKDFLNINTPDSLKSLVLDYIADNLNTIAYLNYIDEPTHLREHVTLPPTLNEILLEKLQKPRHNRVNNNVAKMFTPQQMKLSKIKLKDSKITDSGLSAFMEHKPRELVLHKCENLTYSSLKIINKNSENLISLTIGPSTYVISNEDDDSVDNHYVLETPNLRKLVINNSNRTISFMWFKLSLMHLDLSECITSSSLLDISSLRHLQNLILYEVRLEDELVDMISKLNQLKVLDISTSGEKLGRYANPDALLTHLVDSLVNLTHLDISGTNLAGNGAAIITEEVYRDRQLVEVITCDIHGLISRVGKPLEFLGLYGTKHEACRRRDIPAKKIAGDANPEQIFNAAEAYSHRPAVLTKVLNDLYYMFRYENDADVYRALSLILDAMDEHTSEKHIQISGSASLFYIVKGKEKANLSIKLKHRIISAIVNAMDDHIDDETMMRNGCLTLCQFVIPGDIMYEYQRIVPILLQGVHDVHQEGFVQRIAIYLLNSLACQVNSSQKLYLGNNGAITKMLNLIADRIKWSVCDDVLEVAWSTMWNVTDETPENCVRFLAGNGMDLFLGCLKAFPDKEELLRNMMGLLGNIAEVNDLRPRLMDKLFITVFYNLLSSTSDGIEVSYNAAGILAHIASDGPEAWTIEHPSRDLVLSRMSEAIARWDLRTKRNINYRSFEPILCLLNTQHTSQCQYWAAWALANLTTVYPDKYCDLLAQEGGLQLLNTFVSSPGKDSVINDLALMVLNNCSRYSLSSEPPTDDAQNAQDN